MGEVRSPISARPEDFARIKAIPGNGGPGDPTGIFRTAYYVPDTGECIAGPPCGRSLVRIPLRVDGGVIVAGDPGPLPAD